MWHFRCKNCSAREPQKCRTCETGRFLADCKAAIDLISWYEHEYHHADLYHEDMIHDLKAIVREVEQQGSVAPVHRQLFVQIEHRVDGWLYQVI